MKGSMWTGKKRYWPFFLTLFAIYRINELENELKIKQDRVIEVRREYEDQLNQGEGIEAKVRELETREKLDYASQRGAENKEKKL